MADLSTLIDQYDIKILSDYIPMDSDEEPRLNYIPMDSDEEPRLKWKVGLYVMKDRVLDVEYTAGMAHAPSYPAACAVEECRTGLRAGSTEFKKHYIKPDARDVIRSVMLDSRALDYGCFEDWARDYGYDTDSRAAEAVYRLCLQRAVMLRASLGKEKFDALQLAALTED